MTAIGFALTDEQLRLREKARDFARREIDPVAKDHDAKASFPWTVLERARAAGLRNICVPRSYGGLGHGVLEGCFVVEEIAHGCGGVANAFTINEVVSLPIISDGTKEQCRKWLGALVEGQLGSLAVTEPGAGSDLGAMASTATRRGDEYVLHGTKTLISNVAESAFFLLFAKTPGSDSRSGMSAFIVPRESPGLRVARVFDKMGQRASDTGEIELHEVVIPASHRIGAEGQGLAIMTKAFGGARPWTAAATLGVGRRAMEESVRYAKERQASGQPIWKHQAIGHKLAEMAMNLEAGRLLMWKAAWGVDIGQAAPELLACAKTFAADSVMTICTDAVQIFGGYGYMRDFPVEKLMRDAKAFQIYDGTSEIQRNVIARHLVRRTGG
ncbi:acyl-CoA dehydrogenase family protein [Pendulispora rubella]|uniref:Acyl-CoA dehydrogenase family protein n=1 Tax=Pendulispora rubella TaxID=2741070 RepID=A0ABZ2KW54_9BACT